MPKPVKKALSFLPSSWTVVCLRSVYDLSAGERRVSNLHFTYPTLEEAWREDCANLGGDFARALCRLRQERPA